MKPTTISDKGIAQIVLSEGLKLRAYMDSAAIWTIGIGTTRYLGKTRVQRGDVISKEQAYEYFRYDVRGACKDVDDLTTDRINQHQFDALVSFVYNCGRGNYQASTLRKLINHNPNNSNIRSEFMKWVYAGGHVVTGLVKRRKREADLYFSH